MIWPGLYRQGKDYDEFEFFSPTTEFLGALDWLDDDIEE